jgi:phage/plasmid primase-like uncharacterized protein
VASHRLDRFARDYCKPVPAPKKIFSRFSGGAVHFAPAAKRLAIAEGIETTLSVMQACPGLACWSALALGNVASVAIPDGVDELILCADADNKDSRAAERVLDAAARAHWREGRTIRVALPPPGMDFNDVLTQGAA